VHPGANEVVELRTGGGVPAMVVAPGGQRLPITDPTAQREG
jgi:hypothetical protein